MVHQTMRCNSCKAVYHYNYRLDAGKKINTVRLGQVTVLFGNLKVAFEKDFIEYHEMLQVRDVLSSKAIDRTAKQRSGTMKR